jgi:hypothetical protein
MPMIYVKTVEGRVARSAPRGPHIPSDRYVKVEHTPYIERLLTVHGDIIRKPADEAPKSKKPAVAPEQSA